MCIFIPSPSHPIAPMGSWDTRNLKVLLRIKMKVNSKRCLQPPWWGSWALLYLLRKVNRIKDFPSPSKPVSPQADALVTP